METVCIGDSTDSIRWRPLGLAVKGWHEAFQHKYLAAASVSSGLPFSDCLGGLYALMGIGAARIYLSPQSTERNRALYGFIAQLIVNFFWSLIFFNAQSYLFAFFWLIMLLLLVLWMLLLFHRVDPLSAKLQIPYLLWLSFAAYLNLGVWYLNR